MLYGQFVGSWDGVLRYLDAEEIRHETTPEVHFGWVLDGRAVQDVWIAPSRQGRREGERLLMHDSTFRIYDPQTDSWQITRAATAAELDGLLGRIIARIIKLFTRTGYLIEEQGMSYLAEADTDCALTRLQAAACTYRVAA